MSAINQMLMSLSIAKSIGIVGYYADETSSGTTSLSVTYGGSLSGGSRSSTQSGDIVIVAVCSSDADDINFSISGYTEVADLYANNGSSTADCSLAVYYKILSSTENSFTVIGNQTSEFVIATMVLSDVNATQPDVATKTNTITGDTVAEFDDITPVTAKSAVIGICGISGTGSINDLLSTAPNYFRNGTGYAYVGIATYLDSSGTVTPATCIKDGLVRASASVTLAIRPV